MQSCREREKRHEKRNTTADFDKKEQAKLVSLNYEAQHQLKHTIEVNNE